MNFKAFLCAALFLACLDQARCSTNITLFAANVAGQGASTSLDVSNSQVAKVVYGYCKGANSFLSVNYGNWSIALKSNEVGNLPRLPVVVGPAVVAVSADSSIVGSTATCTVELTDLGGTSTSSLPSTAVVIPTDSGGPVNIILESSSDLINWYPSLPGTYGANYTNRFFRVRAQLAP